MIITIEGNDFPKAPTVGTLADIQIAVDLQQQALTSLLEFAKVRLVEVRVPEVRARYVNYWNTYARVIDDCDASDNFSLYQFIMSIGSVNDAEGSWASHVIGVMGSDRADDVIYNCNSVLKILQRAEKK